MDENPECAEVDLMDMGGDANAKTNTTEGSDSEVNVSMETSGSASATATNHTSLQNKKSTKSVSTGKYFIAIHLGAGKHSLKQNCQDSYKSLCQAACKKALTILKSGGSADDAVTQATVILENSELVNAGSGSELNCEQKVECDAGFMNGTGYFGGVGAVSGVRNPILVARKIAQLQFTKENIRPGVVPPNFLVGNSAKAWAASQGIPTCEDDELVSKRALRSYDKAMRLTTPAKFAGSKRKMSDPEEDDIDIATEVNDTVGAIALDSNGHMAASVSSGGNQIKLPGRIGHSPVFGCGCWASDCDKQNDGVAISVSGVGEMLTKIRWAYECASCLRNEDHDNPAEAMSFAIRQKYLESPLLKLHTEHKLIGALGLIWNGTHGDLIWGYKSPTFILSYAGSQFPNPQIKILSSVDSDEIAVGGLSF